MDISFAPDFAVDDASCKTATGKTFEVQFARAGDKTTVNVYHERIQTRAKADGLRRAWGEALDRLRAKLPA